MSQFLLHPAFKTLLLVIGLSSIAVGCSSLPLSSNALPSPSETIKDIRPSPSLGAASPKPTLRPSPKAIEPAFVNAHTQFSFDLFSTLQKQAPTQNLFISPTSIQLALAMTYNGTAGETQTAMSQALRLGGLSIDRFNASHEDLREALQYPDPEVSLKIANSIWANQGTTFKPNFLKVNQRFYEAKAETLNFKDVGAINLINNWVKRNTEGKIEKILDRLSGDERLFLINATYFKGNWSIPFDKAKTQPQPFTTPTGKKTVPLMSNRDRYRYLETDEFQAVSLPYGKNRRLSLYVVLPKGDRSLSEVTALVSKSDLAKTPSAKESNWFNQFRPQEGTILIPRFKLDYETDLKSALSQLGMGVAFTGQANFSNLAEGGSMIDSIRHKTVVEVNETGTEAAAVTSVGIVPTSIQVPDTPFEFRADRPFLCLLRDQQTGAILFMGAIVNP